MQRASFEIRPFSALVGAAVAVMALALAGMQQGPSVERSLELKLPGTPITSLPFTVDECGSYFLTDCLTGVSGQHGITIQADDVTLDLNGFTLTGVPGSLGGVTAVGPLENVSVQNGTVRGWGGTGLDLQSSNASRADGVRSFGNGGSGITIGDGGLVTGCSTFNNGLDGILAGIGCLVVDCVAAGNLATGVNGGQNAMVHTCVTTLNGLDGIAVFDGHVAESTSKGNGGSDLNLAAGSTSSDSH